MTIKSSSSKKNKENVVQAQSSYERQFDITELFLSLQDEHGIIFMEQIEGELFIYKPIGRRDWSDVCSNAELNDYEKEEVICTLCTLYPKNYDFENCVAGIPTSLYKKIIDNSSLKLDDMINTLAYYRDDMETLNNKMTCIINEAFPNHDLEEIENWGIDKTIKYFTRAEWKLAALRKINFDEDIMDILNNAYNSNENKNPEETLPSETSELTNSKKLTPEKLRELQQKFPEIDWANDSSYNNKF